MGDNEFKRHVAQNVQWAIHEANRLRGGVRTATPDPETLWNMVAEDTRRFFLLQAEVAIGMCAERWGKARG